MKGKYTAVYSILGLTWDVGTEDVLLFDLPKANATVLLSGDPDRHCAVIDRQVSVATGMLAKVFNGEEEPFDVGLARRMAELREARSKQKQGTYLVFDATFDIDIDELEHARDCGDFTISLHDIDKHKICEQFAGSVPSMLAAVSLTLDTEPQIHKVGDVVFLIDPDGRVIHTFSFEMSASVTTARSFATDDVASMAGLAARLEEEPDLARVVRLLTLSLGEKSDNLRSFLSAWTGFEIFINKVFKQYERKWVLRFTGPDAPSLSDKYFDRVSAVLQDKYRLYDKFLVIAAQLDPAGADADLGLFHGDKKVRDELSHGAFIPDASLPTSTTIMLFRKYLLLHLKAKLNEKPTG
jgi:hypothetical protein